MAHGRAMAAALWCGGLAMAAPAMAQEGPASASIPGLEDADFRVRPAPLRREGTFLLRQRGVIVNLPSGEAAFVFQPDQHGVAERPMVLVPSQTLQRIEQLASDHPPEAPLVFDLTGQVFAYRGVNYLLPTAYHIVRETAEAVEVPFRGPDDAPTASSPPAPAPAPGAPASGPAVQDLIKQLEAQRERPRTIEPGIPPPLPPSSKARAELDPEASAAGTPAAGRDSKGLIPEGRVVLRRRARMVRQPGGEGVSGGGAWAVVFDSSPDGDPELDRPMTLVPSLNLQRMEAWAASRGDAVTLEVSGQVLAYEGRNYLIPTMYRVYPRGAAEELSPR